MKDLVHIAQYWIPYIICDEWKLCMQITIHNTQRHIHQYIKQKQIYKVNWLFFSEYVVHRPIVVILFWKMFQEVKWIDCKDFRINVCVSWQNRHVGNILPHFEKLTLAKIQDRIIYNIFDAYI